MDPIITNTYYILLKPLMPRTVQIFLRRLIAERIRKGNGHAWPIQERAGEKPRNWPGWPNGKKFALVLTHDIESPKGVKKCLPVMEIEKKHGFRSCFNFVPHDYAVPLEFQRDIKNEGFEIGVHGLTHKGNMFYDRRSFERQSIQINRYLKEWGSSGFRAPSMYHNLEWIEELDIEYDCSTFDTDPFEPQPDGAGTIFPFSVNGNDSRAGYIELPYTLPQDFTVFVLLRHKHIDVWKRKLDWIAEKGGMALLITHPDYMNFGHTRMVCDEYPADLYIEFLNYVKTRYEGKYWMALPHEMATFWKRTLLNRAATGVSNVKKYTRFSFGR